MNEADLRQATDGALMVAVGRYRQDALAEIYNRHAGAVFALATRLLGDQSRAEDVTQEIFLKLWNEPTAFDPDRGSLRTFLSTQAHSRSVDMIRSESARHRREEREASRVGTMIDNLEREVVDLTTAEEVKKAYALLPEQEREAIELAYFKGHTYREVATLLGTPEGTVKGRIRSALKRLRNTLHDQVVEG